MDDGIDRSAYAWSVAELASSDTLLSLFAIGGDVSSARTGVLVTRLGSLDRPSAFCRDGGSNGLYTKVKITGRLDTGRDLRRRSALRAMIDDDALDRPWVSSESERATWWRRTRAVREAPLWSE